jgi:hypothetical protein
LEENDGPTNKRDFIVYASVLVCAVHKPRDPSGSAWVLRYQKVRQRDTVDSELSCPPFDLRKAWKHWL